MDVLKKMKEKLIQGGLLYIAVKEKRPGAAEEEIKREEDYGYGYERFFSYFEMQELKDDFRKLDMELIWESKHDASRASRSTNWLQVIGKKI